MKNKKKYKSCPDCGTHLRVYDSYCANCGHIFRIPKRKKLKL